MKIWVAGHNGMVGSALVRRLQRDGHEIITIDRKDLDLRSQTAVDEYVSVQEPDWIFIAAARVGGIQINATMPADFLYDNMMISSNILSAAYRHGIDKVMVLGASCMYPRLADQPVSESSLLTGSLEPTNEGYAVAKIAGLKLAQSYRQQYGCDFITAIPAASYGAGDNLDVAENHVIPGLMRRMVEAKNRNDKEFWVWGTGKVLREFLFVDDMADGLVFLMENYSSIDPINLGSGIEVSIASLARKIAEVVGYRGEILFDTNKPDGMPRKLLSSNRVLKMGWKPHHSLSAGLEIAYADFLQRTEGSR